MKKIGTESSGWWGPHDTQRGGSGPHEEGPIEPEKETSAKTEYYDQLTRFWGKTYGSKGPMFYHESPIQNYASIRKKGLTDDSNFCTIGKPSNFILTDKVRVGFRVPYSQLDRINPDMRYNADAPYHDVMSQHKGSIIGSDASFGGQVPRDWIVSIEKVPVKKTFAERLVK